MIAGPRPARPLAANLQLPATLLARYLFFLSRRPISRANAHYLERRLAGLRSLGGELAAGGDARLEAAAAELARLTPGNFARRVGQLEALLAPALLREPPADVVLSAAPPGDAFFAPVGRAALLLGPAIGVGDEILALAAARALRDRLSNRAAPADRPAAEIVVFTGYPGLWEALGASAAAVDRAVAYERYADLLGVLRGDGPEGRFDLVALVDFEKPDLAAAVAFEGATERYVELALGAGEAVCFDAEARWLHRAGWDGAAPRNHYARLARLLAWLGGLPAGAGPGAGALFTRRPPRAARPPAADGAAAARSTLLVAPFTSKHEPSLAWWSRLVAALLPADALPAWRIAVDPGPNHTTARFASALVETLRGALPAGAAVGPAGGEDGRALPLGGALAAIAAADVVVASDSYAAHAAPLGGATGLVVAAAGLADWRVPAPRSFYFDEALPLAAIAASMRRAIAAGGDLAGAAPRPWSPPGAARLAAATARLARSFAEPRLRERGGRAGDELCQLYDELGRELRTLAAGLDHWPRELDALRGDREYPLLLPPLSAAAARRCHEGGLDSGLALHLRARFEEWENSNLQKYLRLLAAPAERPEERSAARAPALSPARSSATAAAGEPRR